VWLVPVQVRTACSACLLVIGPLPQMSVLHGVGSARLGAQLGVPAATVRGWLRRLRARAGQMLQEATAG
jgi:hypothetical protein